MFSVPILSFLSMMSHSFSEVPIQRRALVIVESVPMVFLLVLFFRLTIVIAPSWSSSSVSSPLFVAYKTSVLGFKSWESSRIPYDDQDSSLDCTGFFVISATVVSIGLYFS